jgi:hypothetical protein
VTNGIPGPDFEPADIMGGLYGEGIIALKGAFDTAFADRMYSEIMALFEEARQVPGGRCRAGRSASMSRCSPSGSAGS